MLPSDQLSTRSIAMPGKAPPMSSRCAEAPENPTSSPSKKIGIDDRHVGRVRGAEVRVVVEDDVAVVDVVAEQRDHVLDDLRHRAHEHRRRVRLGELVAVARRRCPAPRSSDSRMIEEYDMRKRTPAISLAIDAKRPADDAHEDRRRQRRRALGGLGSGRGRCSRSRCCRAGRSAPRARAGRPWWCRTAR